MCMCVCVGVGTCVCVRMNLILAVQVHCRDALTQDRSASHVRFLRKAGARSIEVKGLGL